MTEPQAQISIELDDLRRLRAAMRNAKAMVASCNKTLTAARLERAGRVRDGLLPPRRTALALLGVKP
jgi:hypothetical protein